MTAVARAATAICPACGETSRGIESDSPPALLGIGPSQGQRVHLSQGVRGCGCQKRACRRRPRACRHWTSKMRGYYAWKDREVSQHAREDASLSAEIQQIFLEHHKRYGSPRIHAALKTQGIHCSRKRVVRLMQQLGLSAQTKHSHKPQTVSDPHARFAPNHLGRALTAVNLKNK